MKETYRYRLYTESKRVARLEELFNDIEGYTVYVANGVWKGIAEPSVIFEVVSDSLGMLSVLQTIAQIIRHENNQEAVLVTREQIEAFVF